jgi:hypothetical protein
VEDVKAYFALAGATAFDAARLWSFLPVRVRWTSLVGDLVICACGEELVWVLTGVLADALKHVMSISDNAVAICFMTDTSFRSSAQP